MRERKSSRFSGKVGYNAERTQAASQYGYLNLPRGVSMFKESGSGGADKRVALLDFLPYKVTDPRHPDRDDKRAIAVLGELWYRRPFRVHRNVGAANDAVVCLTSFSKRCPICDERAKRAKEGAEKEEIDALKSSRRNLYIVVPLKNKDYEEKPHIWDISDFCFQKLLTEELRLQPDFEKFPDPEMGLTLRIRFSENQLGRNKFSEAARIDFEEREQQYDEAEIMAAMPNLDVLLSELSYKELEAKFFEIEPEEGGHAPLSAQAETEDDVPDPAVPDEEMETGQDGCLACQGTGKSSRGRKCPSCDGTGQQRLPEVVKEESRRILDAPKAAVNEEGKPTLRRRSISTTPSPVQQAPPVATPISKKAAVNATDSSTPQTDKASVDKCPHGHQFGKDAEEFDDCDTCKVWESCIDTKEGKA